MSLRPFLAALLASLASAPAVARAEGLAPALVRALARPGRAHPLADERGNVPLSVVLPPGVDAAALGLSPVAPGIGAIRLAPERVAPFAAAHPDLAIGVAPRLHPLLDVAGTWTHVDAFRQATNGIDGKGVVVGVVDTGLDVRHPDFRTKDGHTRVAWMLVSGKPKGLHPDLEQAFGCTDPTTPCAIYAAADIDAVIATSDDELRDHDGHGTHVSSIAAGNGGPSVTAKPRYVGLAPEATLIVAAPSPSSAEGFVDTEILNGARFVFDRADAMGMPAVLNLSLGSDYGSHDGTSALEKGLTAFVGDDRPGHVIVVSAGNSGELTSAATFCPASIASECAALPPLGIHTEAHVDDGEVVRVPMLATNAVSSGEVFVWLTFRPGDDISVGLEGPCGTTWVGLTGRNDENGYQSGSNSASIVNDLPSVDADLTADTNSAIIDFSGAWGAQSTCGGASVDTEFAVRLRGHGDASLWITAQGDALGGMSFERALRPGTINVPASAPGLLAVGCTVNRVGWKPLDGPAVVLGELGDDTNPVADSACYFSSSGPTPFGVEKPEISAPGGFVAAAMSADADPRKNPGGLFDLGGCPSGDAYCAVVDARHALATGTSMSAPQVAGAIALLMGIDPTLTQARATAVLQAGARLSKGHIPDPNQLGPGSLDVEGARVALLESMTAPTAADPSKSWYSLSSAYARPDPTWPVWGTIELRKSDGTTASGVDGELELSLTGGGKVYQPITRVRPGLFRFAVAGLPRDLGQTITVEVSQAGVSLGARTLPVGWDTWSADDPSVAAVGACEASPSSSAPRVGLMLLAVAVAGRARRRRRPSAG